MWDTLSISVTTIKRLISKSKLHFRTYCNESPPGERFAGRESEWPELNGKRSTRRERERERERGGGGERGKQRSHFPNADVLIDYNTHYESGLGLIASATQYYN